jgi:hypothetical protein
LIHRFDIIPVFSFPQTQRPRTMINAKDQKRQILASISIPALRLDQRFLQQLSAAVRAPGNSRQHKFESAAFIEHVGKNPVERDLCLFRPTSFASRDLRFGFTDGLGLDAD